MKKAFIIILSVLAALIIAFCVFFKLTVGSRTFTDFDAVKSRDAYFFLLEQGLSGDKLVKEERLAPFGDYDNYYFQFRRTTEFVFTSYGETLICEYSKDNYALQKSKMLQNGFFKDKIIDEDGCCLLSEASTDIKDWHFMVMCVQDTCLPKNFRILGYNDSLRQIAILSFSDQDLDEMDRDLKSFIETYFKYDFEKQERIR